MTTAFERQSIDKTFLKEHPTWCKDLLKDFVTSGGDWSSSELSPAIRDDPVLQSQCRTRGYMIMQMGDQLRQVYCGSPTLGHTDEGTDCPQCGEPFCLEHLAEHMGASTSRIDPTAFTIGQPSDPGQNPNPYLSAPPGVDTRPGMSSWDNRELNRNEQWEQKQRLDKLTDLRKDREGSSLVNAMWHHIHKAEAQKGRTWIQKNGDSGEHTMEPEQILALDPISRLVFEVWAYNDEYKAPASTADIAVELATRGIDQEFQDQLEEAAHENENWLPQVLEELANQGIIDKSPYGGWIPTTRVVTKGGVGSGITGHTTPKDTPAADRDILIDPKLGIKPNQAIRIEIPGKDPIEGEAKYATAAGVFYSTPDGKMHLALREWVRTKPEGGEWSKPDVQTKLTAPKPVETPTTTPVEPTTPQLTGRHPAGYTGPVETEGLGKGYPVVGTVLYGQNSFYGNVHGPVERYEAGGASGTPWARIRDDKGETVAVLGSRLSVDEPPVPLSRSISISQLVSNRITERAHNAGHDYSSEQVKGAPVIEGVTITHWEPAKGGKVVETTRDIKRDDVTGEAIRGPDGRLQWTETKMRTLPYGEKEVRDAMDKFTPQEREGMKLEVWDDKSVNSAEKYYNLPGSNRGFKTGGGVYLPGENRVMIGRMTDHFLKQKEIPGIGPYITGTYIHETGHHVWFTKLTEDERSEWKDYYHGGYGYGANKEHREDFATNLGEYSTKNYKEGFAEATRYYKLKPDYLKEKMPRAYTLMDKIYKRVKEHPEKGTETRNSIFD